GGFGGAMQSAGQAVGGAMQVAGAAPMAFGGGGAMPMGGFGPIGQTRNPVMSLVIGVICGVYLLYLILVESNELNAFRQRDDINPILFLVPILNIIMVWGLPAKVLEAKQMAGVPNANVAHPILYLFLWPYFFTADLNEVWSAAQGGRQGY